MQIKKRNGKIVDFNKNRIITAIQKSMRDTTDGEDYTLCEKIANNIEKIISKKTTSETHCVEEIQDIVEKELMKSSRKDVAKQYILYRDYRNKNRTTNSNYKLLDDEFISKYKHLSSPMKQLGEFVYYRTYSRWLENEKRREKWWETCRRVVEFNCGLVENVSKQEAEDLYDNIFHLRLFPSGRTLWSGGIETSYTNPTSQFNCSFTVIDDFDVYKDICYLLMLGVGVGFSVEKKHINNLPKVKGNIQTTHKIYTPINGSDRKEVTEYVINKDVMQIIVGDSKVGWSQAIDYFLKAFYHIDFKHINTIIINYDNVRPFGEKLKTFGGTASGHTALQTIFEKIYDILNSTNTSFKKLKPVDCMDIGNIIAEGIVVGGTRRSAEMCIFDADDIEIRNAKSNLYTMDDKGIWSANDKVLHRMMSNNSIAYYEKPSFEELKARFEVIKNSAEGNFFNMESAKKRNPNTMGTNPSMPKGVLVQTMDGIFDISELEGKNFKIKSLDGEIVDAKCWLSSEKAEVFEIDFKGKRKTFATAQHKFPVIEGNKIIRKEVKDLKKSDKIPLNRNELLGFSKTLTYDDGLFAGIMIGDGSITQRKDDKRYVGSLTVSCPDIKTFVNNFYFKKTNKNLCWNRRTTESKCEETNFGMKEFVFDYLLNTLKIPLSKDGKSVPTTVFTEGDNFILGFIDGLISTDGCISKDRIVLTTKNENLASEFQKIISFYGISSTIKKAKRKGIKFPNGKTYNNEYVRYDACISMIQAIRFRNIFSLTCSKKQDKLNDLKKHEKTKDVNYVTINSINKHSEEPVWDISVDYKEHVFPSQHCYTGNCGRLCLN